MQSKLLQLR